MSVLLQVDFPYPGPWGEQMSQAMQGLAESIAQAEEDWLGLHQALEEIGGV